MKTKKIIKYGCLGLLGILIIVLISLPFLFKQAFGPTHEIIEIKQSIGGNLICYSEYNADLASWFYDINYKYVNKQGKTTNLGTGEYYGQEWYMNDQIIKAGEWMLLKTGGERGADKLLIGKDNMEPWKTFIISPEKIEKDSLWLSKKINSKNDWSPRKSFIKEIKDNNIFVEYTYRIESENYQEEVKLITYEFDLINGIPEMKNIESKK